MDSNPKVGIIVSHADKVPIRIFLIAATLPAILFGIVEMPSSAGLVRIFSNDS